MKQMRLIKTILSFLLIVFVEQACLNGDKENFGSGQQPFLIMTQTNGITATAMGVQNFSSQAVIFSSSDLDTVTYYVALEAIVSAPKDIDIAFKTNDQNHFQDNYAVDSITYVQMPDSAYHFVQTTGVIKKGTSYAAFQVVFDPTKISADYSYMLTIEPYSPSNPSIFTASNIGRTYFHTIGNPIIGVYNWDFTRVPDGGTSFTGKSTVIYPVTTTKATVRTGYYDNANYIITFDKDAQGNLSNFKATIDTNSGTSGSWTSNGISITSQPVVTVLGSDPNHPTGFSINYSVVGGSGPRDCTDKYYK